MVKEKNIFKLIKERRETFRKKMEWKRAEKHCSGYLTVARLCSVDTKQLTLTVFIVKHIVLQR